MTHGIELSQMVIIVAISGDNFLPVFCSKFKSSLCLSLLSAFELDVMLRELWQPCCGKFVRCDALLLDLDGLGFLLCWLLLLRILREEGRACHDDVYGDVVSDVDVDVVLLEAVLK